MNHVKINFSPPTLLRFVHEIKILTWLVLFSLIVISIMTCKQMVELNTQLKKSQNDVRHAQNLLSEAAKHKGAKEGWSITNVQAQAINTAIFQLNLPWNDLFNTLESATPSHIALLTIEPDAKKNLVKGTAEAKTSEDMIAYIRLLKQQKFFIDVILLKHEIIEQDINKPLRFQFLAQWEQVEK